MTKLASFGAIGLAQTDGITPMIPASSQVKRSIGDLAIFGGMPAFQEPLHVGRPNIGARESLLARINDMLERRWLTNNGPYVQELEERIADLLGIKHCIAMCNGTVALEGV